MKNFKKNKISSSIFFISFFVFCFLQISHIAYADYWFIYKHINTDNTYKFRVSNGYSSLQECKDGIGVDFVHTSVDLTDGTVSTYTVVILCKEYSSVPSIVTLRKFLSLTSSSTLIGLFV